jgi:hypothetical protein
MADEQLEKNIGNLLESAQPVADLPADMRGRVMSALADTKMNKGGLLKRWRLATAIGVAAVVLFALGFIPFPAGSAKGALSRAMAAVNSVVTVHIVGSAWSPNTGWNKFQEWIAEDGFSRRETYEGNRLATLEFRKGSEVLRCTFPAGKEGVVTYKYYDPTRLNNPNNEMPNRDYVAHLLGFIQHFKLLSDCKISEKRLRSAWGGETDVVELEGILEGNASIDQLNLVDGDLIKIHAEIDPNTNRLRSLTYSKFQKTWQELYETTYEWDIPIPEELKAFQPPTDAKVLRSEFWRERGQQELAHAQTQDWVIILHAIDMDEQGNLLVAISRHPRANSKIPEWINGAVGMNLTDGMGNYQQKTGLYTAFHSRLRECYMGTFLNYKSTGKDKLEKLTLTVHPYPRGEMADQVVTLPPVDLPAKPTMKSIEDIYR